MDNETRSLLCEIDNAITTIKSAFGAPGDYGYNTPKGAALFVLCWRQSDIINHLRKQEAYASSAAPHPIEGMPDRPGYYWAKWRIAAYGTREGDELTPSDTWEIVQVNGNNGDPGSLEELSVSVSGVEQVQWRHYFVWGAHVADLIPEGA